MTHMSEEQARDRLAKDLKRKEIPDPIWKKLKYSEAGKDALEDEGDKGAWQDLVEIAQEEFAYRKSVLEDAGVWGMQRSSSGTNVSKGVDPRLGPYEKDRSEALGEYLAFAATLDPNVEQLRDELFGGELLTPARAWLFAASPANQHFTLKELREWGISPAEHLAKHVGDGWGKMGDGTEYRYEDVYIEPPGETYRKVIFEPLDYGLRSLLRIPRMDGSYLDGNMYYVEQGSVLDVVRWLSTQLAEEFCYAWNEAQATWYLLTGETTPATALTGKLEAFHSDLGTRGNITLKVEPWVPAETVERAYRDMQKEMLKHDNRKIDDKSIALFRFVIREMGGVVSEGNTPDSDLAPYRDAVRQINGFPPKEGIRDENGRVRQKAMQPSWRVLNEHWNQSHPQWGYKNGQGRADSRNFRRAFYEVAKRVVDPYFEDMLIRFRGQSRRYH
jgi:hypothetical protein